MTAQERWMLAIVIVLADVVAVFVPLMALFAAYIVIKRPPRFRAWIGEIYGESPEGQDSSPGGDTPI